MLEKNNLKKHTTRISQFPHKFLKKKTLKNLKKEIPVRYGRTRSTKIFFRSTIPQVSCA